MAPRINQLSTYTLRRARPKEIEFGTVQQVDSQLTIVCGTGVGYVDIGK